VKSAPVGPEELERSKNQIIGAEALRQQSAAGTGQNLAFNELYGQGAEAVFARIREIEKVTAADVQRVARKYLTDEGYILAITKPAPEKPEAKPAPAGQAPPDAK
jgi:zinc protease